MSLSATPQTKLYPDKFRGQVVIITGAAQGIGEVTAIQFATQGATVILVDIQREKLEAVVDRITAQGGSASARVVNLSDDSQVTQFIDGVVKAHSQIHVIIHLAGLYEALPVWKLTTGEYRQVMGINLDAVFFLVRAILPHMNHHGYGRIICASSAAVLGPVPGHASYVAAKAGVVGFMRAIAVEAEGGVTANTIMPGLIASQEVVERYAQPDGSVPFLDKVVETQAVKRRGRMEDVAHTIGFIASSEAGFISGQVFDVGGGRTFH
jgi:NAD(P)-dependent dehydrogenase (short-subunit alcohol dehydrogenase family)